MDSYNQQQHMNGAPNGNAPYGQAAPGYPQQQPYAQQPQGPPPASAPVDAHATTAPNGTTTKTSAIDNNDVEEWKTRFNGVLTNPSEVVKSKSPESAQPWESAFCGCCSPIDACLMTYCCACVTFGKTHHRVHKSADLAGYEPINTSCLLFLAAGCFGLHWIPGAMQRSEIRQQFQLRGNCVTDILSSCCCVLCELTQNDKEVALRQKRGEGQSKGSNAQQYKAPEGMSYEPKV